MKDKEQRTTSGKKEKALNEQRELQANAKQIGDMKELLAEQAEKKNCLESKESRRERKPYYSSSDKRSSLSDAVATEEAEETKRKEREKGRDDARKKAFDEDENISKLHEEPHAERDEERRKTFSGRHSQHCGPYWYDGWCRFGNICHYRHDRCRHMT